VAYTEGHNKTEPSERTNHMNELQVFPYEGKEVYSATKVGIIAFSVPHTNHRENEKILHDSFSEYRTNKGELFSLSLAEFFDRVPALTYKDESKEKQGKTDALFQSMKAFVCIRR
jgi:hypothetical protein